MALQQSPSAIIAPDALATLTARMRGPVILPGDPSYDDVRAIYNAAINRYPAVIAQCLDVADVMAAVNFGREQRLPIAIRGGGHNGPGLGTVDAGLVIDLGLMRGVRIDPEARTARVEGGARLADLHHASHAFGLATPSGIIASTGVGGITLGGGLGHLTRQLGLAIDNLLEVDVVLADGTFVTANAEQHPDLFWALRGGGGNFGVVTSFLFRLHPVDIVYAGPMLWPLSQAGDVLRWYRGFMPQAPETLNGFFAFLTVPAVAPFPEALWGEKMCGVVWCSTEPETAAAETMAPIRAMFGPPALDWVGPIPHPALQLMFDALYPAGHHWYWKADFVTEIPDEAVEIHLRYAADLPTPLSTMHLYPIDGAASHVDQDETAWNYRDARWGMVIVGVSPEADDLSRMTAWARGYWSELHPHSAGGAYINMMMEEGDDRVRAAYGSHYPRLREIKRRYDPGNLFHINQNIPPA